MPTGWRDALSARALSSQGRLLAGRPRCALSPPHPCWVECAPAPHPSGPLGGQQGAGPEGKAQSPGGSCDVGACVSSLSRCFRQVDPSLRDTDRRPGEPGRGPGSKRAARPSRPLAPCSPQSSWPARQECGAATGSLSCLSFLVGVSLTWASKLQGPERALLLPTSTGSLRGSRCLWGQH